MLVGNLKVKLEKKNKNISLEIQTMSEGFIDYFYNYKSNIVAISKKEKNKWLPSKYLIKSKYENKNYSSKVVWNDSIDNLKYELDPPLELKKVHNVLKNTLQNVIDPVTALMILIDNLSEKKSCNKMFKIFDGRRRYNIHLKTIGNVYLEKDRPRSFEGNTIVCGLKVNPLGGHRLKSKWKPKQDKFEDVKLYFASYHKYIFLPVRVDISRWFGNIVVRLLEQKT